MNNTNNLGKVLNRFSVLALAGFLSSGNVIAQSESSLTAPFSIEQMQTLSPTFARYTSAISQDLWQRKDLTPHDRSLITVSAAIARNQTVLMPEQIALALDNGVSAEEILGAITHLAFYAGWGNAIAAFTCVDTVFHAKGIQTVKLTELKKDLLPLNEQAEATRAARVLENYGNVPPSLVNDTTNVLFRDLWLQPDLSPRNKSLVTIAALIANGQDKQLPVHLNKAMDNGLTQSEAAAVVNHLAYYAGWPNAYSAMQVLKTVFEARK